MKDLKQIYEKQAQLSDLLYEARTLARQLYLDWDDIASEYSLEMSEVVKGENTLTLQLVGDYAVAIEKKSKYERLETELEHVSIKL